MIDQENKALEGKLFQASHPDLKKFKFKSHILCQKYNKTNEYQQLKRSKILNKLFKKIGKNPAILGPIYIHYGRHTTIGDNFIAGFNLTIQDDTSVNIGDNCFLGPNVTIVTPIHPLLTNERFKLLDRNGNKETLCYAKPVNIGNNCWICSNVVICSGVKIGNNCVIGAGSVVTKDIPSNTFAAGNPCKVIRTLTSNDSLLNHPEILDGCNIIK